MKELEIPLTWVLAIVILVSLFIGNPDREKSGSVLEMTDTGKTTSAIFEENCKTVSNYFEDFISEEVDYNKYYATNAIIKGTLLGSKDSITVDEHKAGHSNLFPKYDFSYKAPLVLLPGVNPETKEMDGSVRFYFSLNVTVTESQKSVSIPMYESFDFDENGKFLLQQYYGDITGYINSLNEE